MAELHETLKYLSPTEWEDVPQDDLADYLSHHFTAGELLCNSVPPPPNGTTFESAEPHFSTPNSAKSAKEVFASPVRSSIVHPDHVDLQKSWGKPMKFGQKENPLNVALYKMAGNDRHGAWYARINVFEGIGFSKFRKALQREFPETLLTVGEPGAGAKRGLSAEWRVERRDVEGIGKMEVYQLSAQMPSPVTPREFLTLFMTTDKALTDKSGADAAGGSKHVPRHFMIVSRPLMHPDAPERAKFVRGQYESVELIREIPLHAAEGSDHDPELNPIEWIMVTRSDPAGGVPRFLVDRGTPGAMLTDVTKFLDWCCGQDEIPDEDEDLSKQQELSEQAAQEVKGESDESVGLSNGDGAASSSTREASTSLQKVTQETAAPAAVAQDQSRSQGGMFSNVTSTVTAGMDTYAPASVSNFVHKQISPDQPDVDEMSDSSDSSSIDSFLSAEEMKRLSTAPEYAPAASTENLSIRSGASSGNLSKSDKKNMSRHDKEILKIAQQREKLEQKLAKKRQTEEDRLKQTQDKEQSEQGKAREKMENEIKKSEERHRKELEKLESKRERELKKAEERRKKKDEQNKLSLVARERDELRSQATLLRRENALLADQVESLQRENTALASKLGKVGGPEVLKSVLDETHKVANVKSATSLASSGSGGSGEKG